MATISYIRRTTNSIVVQLTNLSVYQNDSRVAYWYIVDGTGGTPSTFPNYSSWKYSENLSSNASSGKEITFSGLTSSTRYLIYCLVQAQDNDGNYHDWEFGPKEQWTDGMSDNPVILSMNVSKNNLQVSVTFTCAHFTSDGRYGVLFGDGSVTQTGSINNTNTVTYTYATAGTYTIEVQLWDKNMTVSRTKTVTVTLGSSGGDDGGGGDDSGDDSGDDDIGDGENNSGIFEFEYCNITHGTNYGVAYKLSKYDNSIPWVVRLYPNFGATILSSPQKKIEYSMYTTYDIWDKLDTQVLTVSIENVWTDEVLLTKRSSYIFSYDAPTTDYSHTQVRSLTFTVSNNGLKEDNIYNLLVEGQFASTRYGNSDFQLYLYIDGECVVGASYTSCFGFDFSADINARGCGVHSVALLIYCKTQYANGTSTGLIATRVTSYVIPWEWTDKERNALTNKGPISTITYSRMQNFVNCIDSMLKYRCDTAMYETYKAILNGAVFDSSKEGRTLTAVKFNAMKNCIGSFSVTGIPDQKSGNPVLGRYFTTLETCLNNAMQLIE